MVQQVASQFTVTRNKNKLSLNAKRFQGEAWLVDNYFEYG